MKEQKSARRRLIAAILTATAIVAGCGLSAPEAPSWDVPITIPLINRHYTSVELLQKLAGDAIRVDSAGNSQLYFERELDSVRLSQLLRLDNINARFDQAVGRIKVVPPADQHQSIAFIDYIPLILGEVPDTGLEVGQSFGPASSFSAAVVDEGSITVTAVNNTGFALDSLRSEIRDQSSGALLGVFVAPQGLADGQQHSQLISLAGKSVSSHIEFDTYFHTTGGLALSLAGRQIDFSLSFSSEIYASSVTGQVASFANDYSQRSYITESIRISAADLENGSLELHSTNSLPLGADLNFVFPEITRLGQPLTVAANIPAAGSFYRSVDLAGWHAAPVDDSLQLQITASVPGSGGQQVTIDSEDNFLVDYEIRDLEAATVTGVVPSQGLDWSNTLFELNIPTGFDKASLELATLSIKISNGTPFSGNIELELSGDNGKQLLISGEILSRSGQAASLSEIYSDQIAELLTPLPQSITVTGIATIGDGVSQVTFTNEDYFSAIATISAPMAFSLAAAEVEGEVNELSVSDDVADAADRLHFGRFNGTIRNRLPLGAGIEIHIATDVANLFTQPDVVIGPLNVAAAEVDGNGIAIAEVVSENQIEVTEQQLQVFQQPLLYVAPFLALPGTNGQIVRIRANDYLAISGVVTIDARIGGEE